MSEILDEACRRLRLECTSTVLPWRRALLLAENGQVDGLYSVADIPERRTFFHVLRPVLQFHYTLFENERTPERYAGPETLRGRIVAAYGPSATSSVLTTLAERYTLAQTLTETDNLTALRKLAAARYAANGLILINESVANWLIATNGISGVRPAERVVAMTYSFGLSRATASAELAERFNASLLALCREGFIARVAKRHQVMPATCD